MGIISEDNRTTTQEIPSGIDATKIADGSVTNSQFQFLANITAAAKTVLDDATVATMVDTLGGASSTGTGGLVRKTSAALVTPDIGTPSAGVLTNCTSLPTTGITGYQGYALQTTTPQFNPADATSYHSGVLISTVDSTGGGVRIGIPRNGTIDTVVLTFTNNGTAGSNETSSAYVRLNNTTDTLITSSIVTDQPAATYSGTNLGIAVVVGNYIEIKWTTPTYATNPTNVRVHSVVYLK